MSEFCPEKKIQNLHVSEFKYYSPNLRTSSLHLKLCSICQERMEFTQLSLNKINSETETIIRIHGLSRRNSKAVRLFWPILWPQQMWVGLRKGKVVPSCAFYFFAFFGCFNASTAVCPRGQTFPLFTRKKKNIFQWPNKATILQRSE